MLRNRLRITVVQLECHPAARIGGRDFTREPFIPAGKLPLMRLAQVGLSVDAMKDRCWQRYDEWSRMRLQAVLDRLKKGYYAQKCDERAPCDPTKTPVWPDVVVFPEYSIPLDHLGLVHEFAQQTGATVFAGTHTLHEDLDRYKEFGFFDGDNTLSLRKWSSPDAIARYAESSIATKSVCPIFNICGSEDLAINALRPKRVLSPFELTAAGTALDSDRCELSETTTKRCNLKPFETMRVCPLKKPWADSTQDLANRPRDKKGVRVLPLICSEALQLPRASIDVHDFDLAIFLAYNKDADPFGPEIERHSRMKIPVVLCNDGRFGGSSITIPEDQRGEYWWSDIPNRGRLPKGDGVIIVDIDTKNLAIPVGVNKVEDRLHILALPAVVPTSTRKSSYRVALRLKALHKKAQRGERVTAEDRNRVIELLLNSESPTPLQERRLRRLLQLTQLSARLWQIHADDIEFGTVGGGDDNSGSVPPGSLRDLETELARKTLEDVKRQLSRRCMDSDQAQAAMHVRNQCATRCHDKEPEALEQVVWCFFDKLSTQAKRVAKRDLTADIADLVLRLGGTSAWLFNVHGDSLHLVVTHNAPFDPVQLAIPGDPADETQCERPDNERPSLAGYVAREKKPVLYREIVHRHGFTVPRKFHPVKSSSKSAIAVPIIDQDKSLLGVLAIESNQANTFLPLHLKELQAESSRFVHSLLVLRDAAKVNRDYKLVWNPLQTKWSISDVLNDFCFDLGASLSETQQAPGFGCTVWYADWDQDYRAHARGAVRFDHEYLTRTLPVCEPFDEDLVPDDYVPKPLSFLGWIICKRKYFADHWREAPYFVRYDKAVRMELEDIVAAPILESDDQELQSNVQVAPAAPEDSEQGKKKKNYKSSLGALCFYFYSGEYGVSTERARDLFEQPRVERMADILSRFIRRSRSLGIRFAEAITRTRLKTGAADINRAFHIIRKQVMECLEADGCSIFVADYRDDDQSDWPSFLKCVSTSGIERDGNSVSESDVDYEVNESREELEELRDSGARIFGRRTKTCLLRRGNDKFTVIRENTTLSRNPPAQGIDEPSSTRALIGNQLTEQPRFAEAYLLSANEHRRFLLIGIFDDTRPDRRPLGVIRVVRSAQSKPFIDADEDLMRSIATVALDIFRDKVNPAGVPVDLGDFFHKLQDFYVEKWPERNEAITATIQRIANPPQLNDGWTRPRVSAILRDLLFVLRPLDAQAWGVSLSVVADEQLNGRVLRMYAYETNAVDEPSLPPEAEPVQECEDSNRWTALHDNHIIRLDLSRLVRLSARQRAKDGFCVPLRLVFDGRPLPAVISVDMARTIDENDPGAIGLILDLVKVVLYGARQLMFLAHGEAAQDPHRIDLLGTKWYSKVCEGDTEPLRKLGILPPLETWSEDRDPLADADGFLWTNDPHAQQPEWVFRRSSRRWIAGLQTATPEQLLRDLVDRASGDTLQHYDYHKAPPRRRFGRHPFECIDNLLLLRDLDVRIHVDRDPRSSPQFLLPLHFLTHKVGFVAATLDPQYLEREVTRRLGPDDETDGQAIELNRQREKLNIIAELIFGLNDAWMQHALSAEMDIEAEEDDEPNTWFPVINVNSEPTPKKPTKRERRPRSTK